MFHVDINIWPYIPVFIKMLAAITPRLSFKHIFSVLFACTQPQSGRGPLWYVVGRLVQTYRKYRTVARRWETGNLHKRSRWISVINDERELLTAIFRSTIIIYDIAWAH